MVCCDYQRLPRGLLPDHLKHTKQRNVIAAELVTVSRHAVIHGVVNCVASHGWLVRYRRYAIPTTCIRDTYEQRKHPQHQNSGGKEFAMTMQQTRHDFFDITGSTYYQLTRVIWRRASTILAWQCRDHLLFRCMSNTTTPTTTTTSTCGIRTDLRNLPSRTGNVCALPHPAVLRGLASCGGGVDEFAAPHRNSSAKQPPGNQLGSPSPPNIRRLTRTTEPTTISYEYECQHC